MKSIVVSSHIREVVAVFNDAETLENAVFDLQMHSFGRRRLHSLIASRHAFERKLRRRDHQIQEMENSRTRRGFMLHWSRSHCAPRRFGTDISEKRGDGIQDAADEGQLDHVGEEQLDHIGEVAEDPVERLRGGAVAGAVRYLARMFERDNHATRAPGRSVRRRSGGG